METRICRTCKEEKELTCFNKLRDGYRSLDCGKCLYQKRKEGIHDYYENNKEHLNGIKAEKVTCECGCTVTKGQLSRHKKTNKHLELMTKK